MASAYQTEGKSVTSMNLALSFALEGNSVLLVSADLRRPDAHTIFLDESCENGIVEYLEGTASIEEVIHESEITNLAITPTIHRANNPSKLLKNSKFKTLLDYGEANFDVMIIDSPAVLPVVDATIFASMCRGVLILAQADQTPINAVHETIARLDHVKASIIGLCLNRVKDLRLENLYGYGSNHYYGYHSS